MKAWARRTKNLEGSGLLRKEDTHPIVQSDAPLSDGKRVLSAPHVGAYAGAAERRFRRGAGARTRLVALARRHF